MAMIDWHKITIQVSSLNPELLKTKLANSPRQSKGTIWLEDVKKNRKTISINIIMNHISFMINKYPTCQAIGNEKLDRKKDVLAANEVASTPVSNIISVIFVSVAYPVWFPLLQYGNLWWLAWRPALRLPAGKPTGHDPEFRNEIRHRARLKLDRDLLTTILQSGNVRLWLCGRPRFVTRRWQMDKK